jgi:hypothetical protein
MSHSANVFGEKNQSFNLIHNYVALLQKLNINYCEYFRIFFNSRVFKHFSGYRIDSQPNNQYRLSPIYAESSNDYLLFRRDDDGECHLVGSDQFFFFTSSQFC